MEEKLRWKVIREELRRIYRIFDRLAGTVEPSYRVLHFFYREGLKIFATDGMARLVLSVGESSHFEGIYSIPLNDLKVILQGRGDEEITFEFSSGAVQILTEGEFMQIKNARRYDLPFHISEGFEEICEVPLESFRDALDFTSVVLEEIESARIIVFDNAVYAIGISHNVGCVSRIGGTDVPHLMLGGIPYVTARHLVKSLGEIREDRVRIGFNGEELSLTCGEFTYHVMLETARTRSAFELLKFLPPKDAEERDLRELLAVLKKAYTFHPRGTIRITRAPGSTAMWQVSMRVASGLYVSKIDGICELDGTLLTGVHKLRSALMRLGNKAMVSRMDRFLLLFSKDKYLFLALV